MLVALARLHQTLLPCEEQIFASWPLSMASRGHRWHVELGPCLLQGYFTAIVLACLTVLWITFPHTAYAERVVQ